MDSTAYTLINIRDGQCCQRHDRLLDQDSDLGPRLGSDSLETQKKVSQTPQYSQQQTVVSVPSANEIHPLTFPPNPVMLHVLKS